jgi:hypothetical protein
MVVVVVIGEWGREEGKWKCKLEHVVELKEVTICVTARNSANVLFNQN